MEVPNNFTFYGVRKVLPVGEYDAKIVDFTFKELTAKSSGKPYVTLSAKVEIQGAFNYVNLSLDPKEKGKATNNLILQLMIQLNKTEQELIDLCQNPVDFFNIAKDKVVKLVSTEKGYLDVKGEAFPPTSTDPSQVINPNDIPF